MNDRIKELMNESVRFHWDHDGQAYEAQVHPEDLEYFAESIVQECIELAADSRYENTRSEYYEGFNEALIYMGNKLRKHFGIEQ